MFLREKARLNGVIVQAYEKFAQGMKSTQKQLEDIVKTGVLPGMTPPRDAPSPSPADDPFTNMGGEGRRFAGYMHGKRGHFQVLLMRQEPRTWKWTTTRPQVSRGSHFPADNAEDLRHQRSDIVVDSTRQLRPARRHACRRCFIYDSRPQGTRKQPVHGTTLFYCAVLAIPYGEHYATNILAGRSTPELTERSCRRTTTATAWCDGALTRLGIRSNAAVPCAAASGHDEAAAGRL